MRLKEFQAKGLDMLTGEGGRDPLIYRFEFIDDNVYHNFRWATAQQSNGERHIGFSHQGNGFTHTRLQIGTWYIWDLLKKRRICG